MRKYAVAADFGRMYNATRPPATVRAPVYTSVGHAHLTLLDKMEKDITSVPA